MQVDLSRSVVDARTVQDEEPPATTDRPLVSTAVSSVSPVQSGIPEKGTPTVDEYKPAIGFGTETSARSVSLTQPKESTTRLLSPPLCKLG